MTANTHVKLLFFAPGFFAIPPRKIKVESGPGRVYFIYDRRIVAVGIEEAAR